ncbi:MAG: hypothetical protein QUS14_15590 [Pyrinomonadaceae bacterium]|nr:hypothetical protein [Pyrinomonadaceae bacterium]
MMLRLTLILLFISATVFSQAVDEKLRAELLAMRERDQAARLKCANGTADEQMKCLVEAAKEIDAPNTKRITEIFDAKGFPSASLVGTDGVKAFFLILQHSGSLELKKKCLAGIRQAFEEKVISPSEYASFVDRLAVDEGKSQIYGSNFEMKDGKLVMSPVEDMANLDSRRKVLGLPPIAEYAKMLKEFYKLEVVIAPQ